MTTVTEMQAPVDVTSDEELPQASTEASVPLNDVQSEPAAPTEVLADQPIRAVKKAAAKKAPAKKAAAASNGDGSSRRTRRTPLFPASTFEDALELATAIYTAGSGQPVRRITLFDGLGKIPDSGPTRQLVTNSAKYKLTTGNHAAEQLALTPEGLQAVGDDVTAASRARARFRLAIESVDVFKQLYEAYLGMH